MWLVQFVYGVSNCGLVVFEIWSTTAPKFFANKYDRGGQQRSTGCLSEVPKQVANKNALPGNRSSILLQNGSRTLKVCGIWDKFVRCRSASFWDGFQIDFQLHIRFPFLSLVFPLSPFPSLPSTTFGDQGCPEAGKDNPKSTLWDPILIIVFVFL